MYSWLQLKVGLGLFALERLQCEVVISAGMNMFFDDHSDVPYEWRPMLL